MSDAFARLFSGQRLEEFKLAQAESAARFALRHNGQEPADRLLGATRALAAAVKVLLDAREKRDKFERENVNRAVGAGGEEGGPSMLTIILVLLVLLGGAYFVFAPAGAADRAEL